MRSRALLACPSFEPKWGNQLWDYNPDYPWIRMVLEVSGLVVPVLLVLGLNRSRVSFLWIAHDPGPELMPLVAILYPDALDPWAQDISTLQPTDESSRRETPSVVRSDADVGPAR